MESLKFVLPIFCLMMGLSAELVSHSPALLLVQTTDHRNETLCAAYYPNLTTLPDAPSEVFYELLDLTPWDGCSRNGTKPVQLDQVDYIPILSRGNCTIEERVTTLKAAGFAGMIIVTPRALKILSNVTILSDFQILLINPSTKEAINKLGSNLKISAYSPSEGVYFDGSLLLIFALAVGSVAIGSFWSGIVRYQLISGSSMDTSNSADRSSMYLPRKLSKEEVSVSLTPMMILVFVFCMVNMLLLLYWFFDYLVYAIIGLFAFASATAVYQCLEPLFMKIITTCACSFNESANRRSIFFRLNQIVLFSIACSLSIVWVVYRKESWAWILQDILGVAFSINMLRLLRLPNFKICTILLVVLFFYDIFFVFITPFFTKNGESIMVEVASGGHSDSSVGGSGKISDDEQLPMLLRVPHLGYHPFDACYTRHSLLGFGDILVPGLLVSFCHYFDLKMKTPFKIYYVSSLTAYALGLITTFIALFVMDMAQPALLYLVPFTVITVTVTAFCRGELTLIWKENDTNRISSSDDSTDGVSPSYGTVDTSADVEQGQVRNH